jgi:methyltransferase (TIGR00027 family)
MSIPTIKRPFDEMENDQDRLKYMMSELELLQVVGDDGIDFSGKTGMWVAYERDLESSRPESQRLFRDPLAKYLCEPYGKRLSTIFAFGLCHAVFDPPGADIGFHYEGHVMYTAARTRLINDRLENWLSDGVDQQVVNLGAGTDTRAFWLDCLKKAAVYLEVDTEPVNTYKNALLAELSAKGQLPELMCPRKTISLDFSLESLKDLTSHGYDPSTPTCWILEGLIMYLKRPAVEQLLAELSTFSAEGSYVILNFASNTQPEQCPGPDEMDQKLVGEHGWTKVDRLFFGDENFSYDRFPAGKPANKIMGFSFYQR